jgi:hypothetical protein
MEAGKTPQGRRERLIHDLEKAMEDLTEASKKASGDVRAGIESAMSRLRDASSTARREQFGPYRERFRSATANLLEGVEKEARKRREHLQGGKRSPATARSTAPRSRVARNSAARVPHRSPPARAKRTTGSG